MYQYKGKVLRVVDADTVDASVDVGFGMTCTQRFRINNYDAPETWRPRNETERVHGERATNRAIELLMGKELIFNSSKLPGIYGRYGAHIKLENGKDFATVMISEGFAKKENY